MPAFSFNTLKLKVSSLSTSRTSLHVRFYKYKSHATTFTDSEAKLHGCLSHDGLHQARYLLEKMSQRMGRYDIDTSNIHWTTLLTKNSKLGFLNEARALFDIMPLKNIVTYNAMLSAYLRCGRLSEARRFFEVMPERNVVSWTALLCGLADAGRICEAKGLFAEMPERNVVSWNVMVVGLIRNGDLEGARMVFDEMPVKNSVSWNAMISGYVEKGRLEEGWVLFEEMAMEDRNVITWTTMIAGYCRAGHVVEAYCLFQRIPERNVVSWTAMIGGFAWNGFYKEALLLFREMKRSSDASPNGETFISLAYACAGIGLHCLGMQLHVQIIVNGLEYDDYGGRLSKSLIHMYSLFGIMDYAHYIFNESSNNYVTQCCNCMINGYIQIGKLEKARNLFDTITIRDKITWTSMIDGYFSIGHVSEACYLFNNMPDKDAVAWTTMISGHVQNELFVEATYFFAEMLAHGIPPLSSSYAVLYGAAGALAYLDYGRQLHSMVIKTQSQFDLILDNSLISMYAKCGEIHDAYRIFSNMTFRDLISWNSMIMGLSQHGLVNETLEVFRDMLESGTCPNSVTFLGILSSCSHTGLLSQGCELFNRMIDIYAIQPGLEHYISMINLLGRAGKVKEAEEFILGLPFESKHAIWGALLGVCRFGDRNADIAKHAAKRLLELDPWNAPGHVQLCNLYAEHGQHMEEEKLRKEMSLKGVRKVPGCSWILKNGRVHVFFSGDKLHLQAGEMLSSLFQTADET